MNQPTVSVRMFDLCDSATIRSGLITAVNAGHGRISREEYPSPLDASIAVSIEIDGIQESFDAVVRIEIFDESGVDSGINPFTTAVNIQPDPAKKSIEFDSYLLSLPIDSHELEIPRAGTYRVELFVNETRLTYLRFKAIQEEGA
ncbi:hypothetical protein [Microbacterium sp. LCT-H2]|uniref:DUF6941 family protein n=1 Tax=Microbacterium sp. LCT-H2 TaxID=1914306 RepID=UPI00115F8C7E|nr:hypothetical protein [Microbacterium sp. LCT-H2]